MTTLLLLTLACRTGAGNPPQTPTPPPAPAPTAQETSPAEVSVLEVNAWLSYEQPEGQSWTSFPYSGPMTPLLRAGDRLWLELRAPPTSSVYIVAWDIDFNFKRVGAIAADPARAAVQRPLYPLTLEAQHEGLRLLAVVVSETPVPELEAQTYPSCGSPAPHIPLTEGPCAFFSRLPTMGPPQVQGPVAPPTGFLELPHGRRVAVYSRNAGQPITAAMFYFARPS